MDRVPEFHLEVHHLTRQRRQHARDAILVELHFAGDGELPVRGGSADRVDLDRRQHFRVERDLARSGGWDDNRFVGKLRRRGAASTSVAGEDGAGEQQGVNHELAGTDHRTTSVPAAAFSRAIARRRFACAST